MVLDGSNMAEPVKELVSSTRAAETGRGQTVLRRESRAGTDEEPSRQRDVEMIEKFGGRRRRVSPH